MYGTRDIELAATLLAQGYEYIGLKEMIGQGYFEFQFESHENMKKDLPMFMAGDLRVAPKLLIHAYKQLKNDLYQNRTNK